LQIAYVNAHSKRLTENLNPLECVLALLTSSAQVVF
jgi:hypothetical protein